MCITPIPFAKRIESMADKPSPGAMRAVPTLRRLAAMRLGDFLGNDRVEVVLRPVSRLGITPDSTLAEVAAAIKWADENRYAAIKCKDNRSSAASQNSAQSTDEDEFECELDDLDDLLDSYFLPQFPGLNPAARELFTRFGEKTTRSGAGRGQPHARRTTSSAGEKQALPLAQRVQAAKNNPDLVIDQVSNMKLRDYLDAFVILTDQNPETIASVKKIERDAPLSFDLSVAEIARFERRRARSDANEHMFEGYLIGPLSLLCDTQPDFLSELESSYEPEPSDEDWEN